MNWVGGARHRVRISEEKKKQKEFFQKRKLTNIYNKLKPQASSTVPCLSQDLLFFQTLDKCVKKSKPNTPPAVTKVDLGLHSKHRKTKSFDIELPLSPDYPASVLELDKTSKRFTGCVSSELAQKHENKNSAKVFDQKSTAGKHSTHDKEAAMKDWKERWLKENHAPVSHGERFKSRGCDEGFLWNTKGNHSETTFLSSVSCNKIPDTSDILPDRKSRHRVNFQKPNEEKNPNGILRGSEPNKPNNVVRKEQISLLQRSDTSKYPSQNCEFNICELFLDPHPTVSSKEVPLMHDAEQSMDESSITDVHKSKNFDNNCQVFTTPRHMEEFYSIQSSNHKKGYIDDDNAPFMELWDRSAFRSDCHEVKAVRGRTYASDLPAKLDTTSQHHLAKTTSKSTACNQELSQRGPEKHIVVINLDEDEENVSTKDSSSVYASKNLDNPQITANSKPSVNLLDIPESLLNENDQLKHMIPILIKEFVSEFCERQHLLKNDLQSKEKGPIKPSMENSSLCDKTINNHSTNADLSTKNADDEELCQWEVEELAVCGSESENITEDEDPMGSFVEYSRKLPIMSQNSAVSVHTKKARIGNSNLVNKTHRNENTGSLVKNNSGLFPHKGLNHKNETDCKRKFSEDYCEPELKDVSSGTENKICGHSMHLTECIETNKCFVLGTQKQAILCHTPASTNIATQTVVSVKHSACQSVQSTMDTSVQTHISRNTQTYNGRSIQTHTDKSVQTHNDQSTQAHVNVGVETHSDKCIQTSWEIVDDVPKTFLKKEPHEM